MDFSMELWTSVGDYGLFVGVMDFCERLWTFRSWLVRGDFRFHADSGRAKWFSTN